MTDKPDQIQAAKRIIALVDDYEQSPSGRTRWALRAAILDELNAATAHERAVWKAPMNLPELPKPDALAGHDRQIPALKLETARAYGAACAAHERERFIPCKGIPDARCSYLADCHTPCNKCGRMHNPMSMLHAQPAASGEVRLQFVDDTAASEFMRKYSPTVKVDDMPAPPPVAPEPDEPCICGDMAPKTGCPGRWEPGCDLGNNEKFVAIEPVAALTDARIKEIWRDVWGTTPIDRHIWIFARAIESELRAPQPKEQT